MRNHCPTCLCWAQSTEWNVETLLHTVRTTPDADRLQHALRLLAGMQRDVEGLEEWVVAALEERDGL